MSQLHLKYFSLRGRGEPARLMLNYRKVQFEDEHISFEDWPKIKQQQPHGVVPVLLIDGKELSQSKAIYRYIARKYDLEGANAFDTAKLDETLELSSDFMDAVKEVFATHAGFAKGDLDTLRKDKLIPALEKYMPLFESALKRTSGDFFSSKGPSYADFVVAPLMETFISFEPEPMSKYSFIEEYIKKFNAIPELQSYLKSRPAYKF